jgi:hypothetical protein
MITLHISKKILVAKYQEEDVGMTGADTRNFEY